MSSETLSLDKYINMAKKSTTHSGRFAILSKLLEEIFNVKLEEILPGIEKKVGNQVFGIKGRIDLLYSNVIFEVKVDLNKEIDDAKKELKKYFQILLEASPKEKLIGIATDVINYIAFIPIIEDNTVKDIKEISSIDISKESASDAILWLDSYIFSKLKIKPTAIDLKFRFGPRSPTYAISIETLRSLWEIVKNEEDVKLKYELWSKNMEIVYGSKPDENAFLDQTYLVTLVKLIAYLKISNENIVDANKILKALKGEYFTEYEIMNIIEEDFFTWIINEKIHERSSKLFCSIAKELLRYDLTQINEDFFKEIYQEIVERGQRHRVGEYYTDEWLTELILRDVIKLKWSKDKKAPRILDPACGSGTFLCNAIRILKEELYQRGWKPNEILNYVITNIVGIDINPLATTIARVNYLIALGELINARKGSLLIPVYVADSIKLPKVVTTLHGNTMVYDYVVDDKHIQIPVTVAKDRKKLSKVITAFKEAIESYRVDKNKIGAYRVFEKAIQDINTEFSVIKPILEYTLSNILSLIDEGKDSIWIYMLSNIYMPIALSESKFDIIVGNPPWIAMRYIENKEYQDFVKNQFIYYELLDSSQVKLFTHIEVATLFFCKVCDIYLENGGIIGFVMPRSILTGALHHVEFKKFKKPTMTLNKIIDLEEVSPLFNVPACVLIATKGGKTTYPVPAIKLSGELPRKNLRLNEASSYLKTINYDYRPPEIPRGKSHYYNFVRAGASIYPRNFFFIEFIIHPTLGISVRKPYCRTSKDAIKNAKEQWKDIVIEGNVEEEFIYATIIGEDLVPFGYTLRPVILPIEPLADKYQLLDVDTLKNRGYRLMAKWFEKAQKIWEERATQRMLLEYPRIISYIDYMRKLTFQNPNKRYVVIYNSSGTNISSCVVDRKNLQNFSSNGFTIMPKGFVAEVKTMFYETNNEMEAHYLCSILNSDIINEIIKPLQTKGLFGERDIIRRPFMFPIPKFNPNDPIHRRLTELSKICHEKISNIIFTKKSIVARRKEARKIVEKEIDEINKLVSQLLGISL